MSITFKNVCNYFTLLKHFCIIFELTDEFNIRDRIRRDKALPCLYDNQFQG